MTVGTARDNAYDKVRAFRGNTDKLTAEAIAEIKALPRKPRSGRLVGVNRLAKKYGVDRHSITSVANGRTWRALGG
jgi:hypothetical protein